MSEKKRLISTNHLDTFSLISRLISLIQSEGQLKEKLQKVQSDHVWLEEQKWKNVEGTKPLDPPITPISSQWDLLQSGRKNYVTTTTAGPVEIKTKIFAVVTYIQLHTTISWARLPSLIDSHINPLLTPPQSVTIHQWRSSVISLLLSNPKYTTTHFRLALPLLSSVYFNDYSLLSVYCYRRNHHQCVLCQTFDSGIQQRHWTGRYRKPWVLKWLFIYLFIYLSF